MVEPIEPVEPVTIPLRGTLTLTPVRGLHLHYRIDGLSGYSGQVQLIDNANSFLYLHGGGLRLSCGEGAGSDWVARVETGGGEVRSIDFPGLLDPDRCCAHGVVLDVAGGCPFCAEERGERMSPTATIEELAERFEGRMALCRKQGLTGDDAAALVLEIEPGLLPGVPEWARDAYEKAKAEAAAGGAAGSGRSD